MMGHLAANPWLWLAFAVLLGLGEIVTPGVFLIWIALAAAITGGVAMLADISLALQFLLFALLCLGSVWLGRRWYADNPVASQDPLLNNRTARLIGEIVVVAEPIRHGKGRVRVGDSVWDCAGADAEAGTAVRVVGAEDAVLLVEPVLTGKAETE